MLKRLLLPVAATLALFVAAPAQATTFTVDSLDVSLNTSGLGLLVDYNPQTPLTFDLNGAGDSFTGTLFTIGTSETALNLDDLLLPRAISVGMHFSAPQPGGWTGNDVNGFTGAAWLGDSFGYVAWTNTLLFEFGSTGLLGISLSDTAFALATQNLWGQVLEHYAPVNATFTLLRADSGSAPIPTPEPSSLALLGLGLAGLAASRRKRRAA